MDAGNRKAILAAMLANLGIAIAKAVGFAVTGAASLLAEAVHSAADTSNQLLLLWGGAAASQAPTPSHPFGYGRERYFWAFVVSLVIFSVGGLFAMYEGTRKLLHPHELASPGIAIAILVVGIVLEGGSLRLAVGEARKRKGKASWWEFVRRTKNPELPVVLLEDLAAMLGLAVALIGISAAAYFGRPELDAIGSIVIGVLLVGISLVLAIEMKSLLIGESASEAQIDHIREALLEGREVQRLIHMRTQHLGPDELLIAAKLEFHPAFCHERLAEAIDAVETRIRGRLPGSAVIYLEPDVHRAARADAPHSPPAPAAGAPSLSEPSD